MTISLKERRGDREGKRGGNEKGIYRQKEDAKRDKGRKKGRVKRREAAYDVPPDPLQTLDITSCRQQLSVTRAPDGSVVLTQQVIRETGEVSVRGC